MVATPSLTSTFSAPPLISRSADRRMSTVSLSAASLCGLSAAAAGAAHTAANAKSAIQILNIVLTGHCTPVHGVEEGCFLTPSRLDFHVQVEEDLDSEEPFHLLAGERSDLFQHRASRPDNDSFLTFALHPDGGVNTGQLRRLLPFIDGDGDRMRHFLAGREQHFLAHQLGGEESLGLIGEVIFGEVCG